MKKMFVRFLCSWPPYKDGQCLEVQDRFGSHFVARGMAEEVTAREVVEYELRTQTIERAVARAVDKHFNETPRAAGKTAGRRVVTEDQWRRELGQKGPSPYRYLPAVLAVRG
jgi:hypothetical protein